MPSLTIKKPTPKIVESHLPKREAVLTPLKHEADDLLDWEAAIETPPMRPSGVLRVRLEYAGRATPVPVDGPDTE